MIKLLAVEDDSIAQFIVRAELGKSGYDIDIASSGDEAIQKAMQTRYDFILMDIGLGNTDGFIVTKAIRAQSMLNKETPIIALTAHEEESYRSKAKEVGMQGFLAKPLRLAKLKEILDKLAGPSAL